jgi:hypothetical protein
MEKANKHSTIYFFFPDQEERKAKSGLITSIKTLSNDTCPKSPISLR